MGRYPYRPSEHPSVEAYHPWYCLPSDSLGRLAVVHLQVGSSQNPLDVNPMPRVAKYRGQRDRCLSSTTFSGTGSLTISPVKHHKFNLIPSGLTMARRMTCRANRRDHQKRIPLQLEQELVARAMPRQVQLSKQDKWLKLPRLLTKEY